MSGKFRNRTTSNLRRVASSLDLLRALKRSRSFAEPKVVGLASPEATSLPPQAPPFLAELPPASFKNGVFWVTNAGEIKPSCNLA